MMPGYSGMGWGVMFMSLAGLVLLVLVGVGVWLFVRASGGSFTSQPRQTSNSAREILAQRYARGEIDEQEYQQRLQMLGG